VQVYSECDDGDVRRALLRDEEGNTGEQEENGHEREAPKEENATTVRVDREQSRSGRDPAAMCARNEGVSGPVLVGS
jgi:hypothetical protein